MKNIISLTRPESAASEDYRILKTHIKLLCNDKSGMVIAVTSAEPGDGRTRTCINLAAALAREGSRTLLIDFDLRHSQIHEIFKVPNKYGLVCLAEGSSGGKCTEIKSGIENLDLLTSGELSLKPWEVLESIDAEALISSLKEKYKYIIMDTPPMNSFADAHMIAGCADGCIMVVTCDKTKKETAAEAKVTLEKLKINILGIVVYRRKMRLRDYFHI